MTKGKKRRKTEGRDGREREAEGRRKKLKDTLMGKKLEGGWGIDLTAYLLS